MMDPDEFEQDEAWVVFQLNDSPVVTREDGDFNCIALMDAASGFIFETAMVPLPAAGPSPFEVRRLFNSCVERSGRPPLKLLLPVEEPQGAFAAEAKRRGITVVQVPEKELSGLTADAVRGFREHVQGVRTANLQ